MENIREKTFMTKQFQLDTFIKFSVVFDYGGGTLDSILVDKLLRLGHMWEMRVAVGTR